MPSPRRTAEPVLASFALRRILADQATAPAPSTRRRDDAEDAADSR